MLYTPPSSPSASTQTSLPGHLPPSIPLTKVTISNAEHATPPSRCAFSPNSTYTLQNKAVITRD